MLLFKNITIAIICFTSELLSKNMFEKVVSKYVLIFLNEMNIVSIFTISNKIFK